MTRVALVSGAGRGLGEKIARALHGAGYRVAVADVGYDQAAAVATALDPRGETACAMALDVREKENFVRVRNALIERWGGVDILVNNAGKSQVAAVMDISPEEFDDVLAINLRGTFLGCQVLGQHFRERGWGRIVNIASLAGQSGGTATGAHYAAAKGGVMTLTKVFARELAAAGVTVNAISPGPLELPIVYETVAADKIAAIKQMIPVGHLGSPEYIADMVLTLVKENASAITGSCVDINGGLFMR